MHKNDGRRDDRTDGQLTRGAAAFAEVGLAAASPAILPSADELLSRVRIVSIPTRTAFRGVRLREAAIFDGPNGASEFSPFLEYDDAESAAWLAAALEFGWGDMPALRRESIAVNATVPAVSAAEVAGVLARFEGCTTAKVKVAERGQTLADDIARVRAVREVMGDEAIVRIDANGGWAVDEAVEALQQLAEFDLDYAEQPCMAVDELAEVRRRITSVEGGAPLVRIAADESVRKAADPLAVAESGAADLLIVKAQPLGGIERAMRIIEAANLPVVVSSALDTSIGISMGLHLAAALPEPGDEHESGGKLAGACGLGTVALLDGDVATEPLLPQGGRLPVRRAILDEAKLSEFAATTDRVKWWRDRITRCRALLSP